MFAEDVFPKSEKVEILTRQILHKELELAKLNTRFRAETTLVSPWRQRRVFLYGESNASLAEAGSLTAMVSRYYLADKKPADLTPAQRSRQRSHLAAAARTQLVGQLIGVGGDIFELGLNFIHYHSIKARGFDPGAYAERVHILHTELDALMEERQNSLNEPSLSSVDRQAAQAEGKLLKDMRDLSLLEYADAHRATKRFWVFQNTAFLVDMAKNGTGATANIINLAGIHLHRRRMAGGAGVFATISGAFVLLTPVVGRVTGNLSGLAARRVSARELTGIQANDNETFYAHRQEFLATTLAMKTVPKTTEPSPYLVGACNRVDLYEQQEKLLSTMQKFLVSQRKQARGTTRENIAFALAVGPPRIANGVLSILSGWRYYNNRPMANKLAAAGATAYASGSGINMLETARVQGSIELSRRQLAKNNLTPHQQFNERLRLLENMDKILTR